MTAEVKKEEASLEEGGSISKDNLIVPYDEKNIKGCLERNTIFSMSKARAEELNGSCNIKKISDGLPLKREMPSSEPFPFDALGPILGPPAKRLHEIIKAPDAICGNSFLAVAALIAQSHANVSIDGRVHPLSLFISSVASSGDRKSAIDGVVLNPVRHFERELHREYLDQKRIYRASLDAWKAKRAAIIKNIDPKQVEKELLALGEEPVAPLLPHLLVEEPTYEAIVKLFHVGRPSMGLFSDEGGRLIGGFAMKNEELLKTITGLSALWDGRNITRIRASDDNLNLYGRRLSSHLMFQPCVLSKLLRDKTFIDQGYLSRYLISFPDTTAGHRSYEAVSVDKDEVIVKYFRDISSLLLLPLPIVEGTQNELSPKGLELSPEAKKIWIKFHDEVDRKSSKDGEFFSIRATANKAPEQVLRISAILTLVECFKETLISTKNLLNAIRLMRFYLGEALRIFDFFEVDPNLELAEALLHWMQRKSREFGPGKIFSLQEIYQKGGPRGVRSKKSALMIMSILEDHDQVKRVEGGWVLKN